MLASLSQELKNRGWPPSEALDLLELATGWPRWRLLGEKITPAAHKRLKNLLKARTTTPLAYLRGWQEFYGYKFIVNQDVLIPRPESEDLVSLALTNLRPEIYDLGTGSGCLGLSLALETGLKPTLVDNCPATLKVARQNAKKHNLSAKFVRQDVRKIKCAPKSLILANLPYLEPERKTSYEQACPQLIAEPNRALYGHLDLYRSLFTQRGATIICEVLGHQTKALVSLARSHGYDLRAHKGLAHLFKRAEPLVG